MIKGSITITNHTDKAIQIVAEPDSSVAESANSNYTIAPKDCFVLFTDRIKSIRWTKAAE